MSVTRDASPSRSPSPRSKSPRLKSPSKSPSPPPNTADAISPKPVSTTSAFRQDPSPTSARDDSDTDGYASDQAYRKSRRRSPHTHTSHPNSYANPSRQARSTSPRTSHAPTHGPPPQAPDPQAALQAEYRKLLDLRSGGTYIPPARLRALQQQIQADTSEEGLRAQQKLQWEALKKAINGLINKCNAANIKHIVPELFAENLIRGRGLLCRSLMKAQAASPTFTPVFAALAAAVNSRLPQVGELLVSRLILQFRKAFRRNDKKVCLAATSFLAHLVNQQVVHEFLALQMLLVLLNKPTDDSVEIAVGFMREVGQFLSEMQPRPLNVVWDRFREILQEGHVDKRVQYAVEVLFQIRKDEFRDHPAVQEALDLLEEEDMITHKLDLDDDDLQARETLNIFRFDPDLEASERAYKKLKAEILGESSDRDTDTSGDESDRDRNSGSDSDSDDSDHDRDGDNDMKQMEIRDQSNTDLVNLRRTIYLTIQSSIDPEEAVHKLLKVALPDNLQHELPSMVMECCAQAHTYQKFYGLIGQRFCQLRRHWADLFAQQFTTTYETIHRYETNKLRNIARFFGHLFASDALNWHSLRVVRLTEDDTTAASRIFLKIFFQEIVEGLGLPALRERLCHDEVLRPSLDGLFPRDTPRNVRFSINYFTSIGLGALTDEAREFLAAMPKTPVPALTEGDSDTESISSYSSGSSRSLSRSRSRSRSLSRSRSRSYSTSRSRSRSYSPSPSRSRSLSSSRSPPRDRRDHRRKADLGKGRDSAGRGRGRDQDRGRPRNRSYSSSRSLSPRFMSRSLSRSVSRSPSRSPSRTPTRRSRLVASPRRPRRSPAPPAPRSPLKSPHRSPPRSRRSPTSHRSARSLSRSLSRSPPRSLSRSPRPKTRDHKTRDHKTRDHKTRDHETKTTQDQDRGRTSRKRAASYFSESSPSPSRDHKRGGGGRGRGTRDRDVRDHDDRTDGRNDDRDPALDHGRDKGLRKERGDPREPRKPREPVYRPRNSRPSRSPPTRSLSPPRKRSFTSHQAPDLDNDNDRPSSDREPSPEASYRRKRARP